MSVQPPKSGLFARSWLLAVCSCVLASASTAAESQSGPSESSARPVAIGIFTAVQGNVFAARPWLERPTVIHRHHPLYDRDVVQTLPRSRAKVLFNDDTLIALGEDSRIQILERAEDLARDSRILVIKLTQGRARVLVGRRFAGPGSRVELQTSTGMVSANEGSFAAWVEPSLTSTDMAPTSTGVTNIGRAPITFSASGQMVTLISGQSSTAQARRPPAPPELLRTALSPVNRVVQDTQIRDQAPPQAPRDILLATGPLATDLRVARQTQTKLGGAAVPPLVPITPPAVISGAAAGETPVSPTGPSLSQSVTPVTPVPVVQSGTGTGGTGAGAGGGTGSPGPGTGQGTPTVTISPPSFSLPTFTLPTFNNNNKKGKGKD